VNDAVGDIDDQRNCPSDTGADKHVTSRPDTCWIRRLVEERPSWQAGVVHGVQVDDQVDFWCRHEVTSPVCHRLHDRGSHGFRESHWPAP
jgi:hypothetical protein